MPKVPDNLYFSLRTFLAALLLAMVIAGCGFGVDFLFHNAQSASKLYASDLYTCLVAFALCYLLLIYEKRRRLLLARRMEIAAEVNHHIRNALTAVVFSASVQNDANLQAVIEDATARIDWVLTTVLPDGTADLRWPVQAKAWRPVSWAEHAESLREK
jgi:hypothetical protein